MARKWKWGVLFSGDNLTLAETIDFAAKAEDAGAESLWTTELGRDAFVPLGRHGSHVQARPPRHRRCRLRPAAGAYRDQRHVHGGA